MPFCSDIFSACFILHRAVRAVLSITELHVNVRAAFRYYKRSQQFRLLAILLNEFNIGLKVLSVGLKPVLHEYLHYSLSWRGISSSLFFPRELFRLNGTSHFYLLAVSFFHMQKACLKWATISVPVLLTLDSGLRASRLNTLMSVAMRNRFNV